MRSRIRVNAATSWLSSAPGSSRRLRACCTWVISSPARFLGARTSTANPVSGQAFSSASPSGRSASLRSTSWASSLARLSPGTFRSPAHSFMKPSNSAADRCSRSASADAGGPSMGSTGPRRAGRVDAGDLAALDGLHPQVDDRPQLVGGRRRPLGQAREQHPIGRPQVQHRDAPGCTEIVGV